jgi:REP element-mobilizing transposase RayT
MGRIARFLKDGVCYYIQSRSNQNRKIFKADPDYERYIRLLKKYKLRYQINIYGYCLLPAEAHLIVHPSDSGNLPLFMQGVNQSYAIYYNICYRRVGKVWGQRFQSNLIYSDHDLIRHIKMIEFLPVQVNRACSPTEHPWSSCTFRIMGSDSIIDPAPPVGPIVPVGN